MMRKRRWIQLLCAVLYNCHVTGFAAGKIDRGMQKGVCVPGLNCYSCPGAVASCPLGALQNALIQSRYRVPYYVLGTLLLFGVVLGRAVCGFLCPFGWLQELLYKLPGRKIRKNRWTRAASWVKYIVLAVLVIGLPLAIRQPAFCKWLCPAGTLEAGLPLVIANEGLRRLAGALFNWKVAVLLVCLAGITVMHRAFCRFLCPLGAFYSLFHRVAVVGMRVDAQKCTGCGKCVRTCRMDVRHVGDRECICCTACVEQCPAKAISFGTRGRAVIEAPLLPDDGMYGKG